MTRILNKNIKHITCGSFNSNSWSTPKAYRIYRDKIESDETGNYFSQRFTKQGYQFLGKLESIDAETLEGVFKIFSQVPSKCFELELPRPNTPGNKSERDIYIQIVLKNGRFTEFKINEYDTGNVVEDSDVLTFKDKIKDIIELIEAAIIR